jgi:hypothetical protein
VSLIAQQCRELSADLALGPACELALEKARERAIRRGGDRAKCVALV